MNAATQYTHAASRYLIRLRSIARRPWHADILSKGFQYLTNFLFKCFLIFLAMPRHSFHFAFQVDATSSMHAFLNYASHASCFASLSRFHYHIFPRYWLAYWFISRLCLLYFIWFIILIIMLSKKYDERFIAKYYKASSRKAMPVSIASVILEILPASSASVINYFHFDMISIAIFFSVYWERHHSNN